ncbi:MAG: hypothetical protein WCP39_00470 [Chlamydiota bacterium]
MQPMVVAFGEAEKGLFQTPLFFRSLIELVEKLGHPPPESEGLYFAIQSLLYHRPILFFRVQEEGYSIEDYIVGLQQLFHKEKEHHFCALCLPGVGNPEILEAAQPLVDRHKSCLIVREKDLYDYLTTF